MIHHLTEGVTAVPEFVLCEHPDLPGQTARMVTPRNGWTPVDAPPVEPPSPPGGEDQLPPGGTPDSPSAGTSTTTQDEE